jgi:hypothetical protein
LSTVLKCARVSHWKWYLLSFSPGDSNNTCLVLLMCICKGMQKVLVSGLSFLAFNCSHKYPHSWLQYVICPLANVDSLQLSGWPVVSPGSTKRVAAIVRPTTPKSPVPTVSAFDSIEDSDDEEDIVPHANNDAAYLSSNGAIVSPSCVFS